MAALIFFFGVYPGPILNSVATQAAAVGVMAGR